MARADSPLLSTTIAGLPLRNCVMLAAGCAGVLDEMHEVLDLSRVGAVTTKSITPEPREGNDPWRVAPVDAGMLNAVGLTNPGIEEFLKAHAPQVARVPTRVIASAAGFSIDDYVKVCAALNTVDALGAVELNVSCPNVKAGCDFAFDPRMLGDLVREVRAVLTHTRLFVKLSPIPAGPVTMASVARVACEPPSSPPTGPNKRPGADALTIANTTPAMAIDVRTRRPLLARVTGGLSGPAVHPVAVKLVFDLYRTFARDAGVPIIGLGGVLRWEHAAEFILAGASAVQVGTGLFVDPRCPIAIVRGLEKWVRDQRASHVSELVGRVLIETPATRSA
jgi:dihydroorotate dehydrogenase (NAD+) catalytic subunit